jgi:hypothetical protein
MKFNLKMRALLNEYFVLQANQQTALSLSFWKVTRPKLCMGLHPQSRVSCLPATVFKLAKGGYTIYGCMQ